MKAIVVFNLQAFKGELTPQVSPQIRDAVDDLKRLIISKKQLTRWGAMAERIRLSWLLN